MKTHSVHRATGFSYSSQRGVVLVVSLVMLLVMTAIGVTIMTGSTLQERMAGNNRQLAVARLNAESALREAEDAIAAMDLTSTPDPEAAIRAKFGTEDDAYAVAIYASGFTYDPLTFNVRKASEWATASGDGSSDSVISASATNTSKTAPKYVIEYIGRMPINESPPDVDISVEKKYSVADIPHAFRITAIGYGNDPKINAILQSIYSTADNL